MSSAREFFVRVKPHEVTPIVSRDLTMKTKWMAEVVKDWDGRSNIDVGIVGVPYDGFARYAFHGVRLPPESVREALFTWCSNYNEDYDTEISGLSIADCGDVAIRDCSKTEESYLTIEKAVGELFRRSSALIMIGGDAAISIPIARALIDPDGAKRRVGLVDFDSHYDLRKMPKPYDHTASDFIRWLMEKEPTPIRGENIAQIGIHGFLYSRDYAQYARKKGISVFKPKDVRRVGMNEVVRQVLSKVTNGTEAFYVHVDIDCIDQTFTAGTGFVGGLMPWDVMDALVELAKHRLCRGLLLVQLNPLTDVNNMTMKLAAEMIMQFLTGLVIRKK